MRLITTPVGLPTATKVQRDAKMPEADRRLVGYHPPEPGQALRARILPHETGRRFRRRRDCGAYRLTPGGHIMLDRRFPVGRMLKPAARAQSEGG